MSEALSNIEIGGQHIELLPARTVMTMFGASSSEGAVGGNSDALGQPTQSNDGNALNFVWGTAGKLLGMKS